MHARLVWPVALASLASLSLAFGAAGCKARPLETASDAGQARSAPADDAAVRSALLRTLDPGGPTEGLKRAVVLEADLGLRPNLEARIRELTKTPSVAPRALGAMLRALSKRDRDKAAALACSAATALGKQTTDLAGDDAYLVESAFVVVAGAGAKCEEATKVLVHDRCAPYLRCDSAGKPLDGRATSRQDEPPCDATALVSALADEEKRTIEDVVLRDVAPRPSLFALAAVSREGQVPSAFVRAHERRRYAVKQPDGPACDRAALGTPCRCDEATMRDEACRRDEGGAAHVGLCRFVVDDKARTITKVVASSPP